MDKNILLKAIKNYVFKNYPDLKHCDLKELIYDLR